MYTTKGLLLTIILITLFESTSESCSYQRCCLISPCTSSYCLQKNSETWISTQNYANYQYTKLVLSNGSCMPCPYNCQACSSQSSCTTCASGFYLSSNSICLLCSYMCNTCVVKNSISKCSSCQTGTYLDSTTTACNNCPSGALACSSATVISSCQSGYLLTSNSMFCVSCPTNCISCPSSDTVCSSCVSGYYLRSGTCFLCNLTNCLTCAYVTSKVMCSSCSSGTYLKSGACLACPSNCNTCSNSTNCTGCLSGYYLVGGGCLLANNLISNCNVYSNSTACSTCNSGFYLNSGLCYPCSIVCTSCYGDHFGLCTVCASNAALFNQMCLVNNYLSQSSYQSYITFPGSSYLISQGSPDCNTIFYSGSSISIILDGLSGYKVVANWRIYSIGGSTSYQISLNNGGGNTSVSSTTSYESGEAFPYCSSNTSKLYYLDISQSSWSVIKYNNSLTFSTNNGLSLALQEVVLQIQSCNSLCVECSDVLCTQCQMTDLYTQDAYCVYTCSSGYYIYLNSSSVFNPKTCVQQCPIDTYALNTNLTCAQCVSPCLSCLNDAFCLSCISDYFLTSANTCQQICPYRYFGEIQTQTCELCVGRCNECINQQQCLNCLIGFYYSQNYSCLDSCSPTVGIQGMYADLSTLTCQPCSSSCLNCEIAPTYCTSCQSNFTFYNYTCLSSCPTGYYPNQNSICTACTYPCEDCLSTTSCTSCVDRYLLQTSCVIDCPSGYYEDNKNLTCTPCLSSCTECVGASNYCTSCANGYFLSSSNCVAICPTGYFGNTTSLLCLQCLGSCFTCTNQTFCLSCHSNFLLGGGCLESTDCGVGLYADITSLECLSCSSNCLTCEYTASYCTSCKNASYTSLIYLQNNNCVSACSTTYYTPELINSILQCVVCPSPCLTCFNNSCLSCLPGYMLSGGVCSTSCSYGYYFNSTSTKCDSCSTNCLTCNTDVFCQVCATNYYIYSLPNNQNQCLSACPSQYYPNTLSTTCQACLYPCANCSSPLNCLSCQTGILYQTRCISNCPDTTFYSNTSSTCLNCLPNCLTCTQSASLCITCLPNYYLTSLNQTCNLNCASSYYPQPITQLCLNCPVSCSSCLNDTYCQTCLSGQTYLSSSSHSCVSSCPIGYFGNDTTGICDSCSSKCLTCSKNASNCVSCAAGYVMVRVTVSELDCAFNCPNGYYSESQSCYTCIFPCSTCSAANACITCVTGTYYYLNTSSCLLSCPSNTYIDSLSQTCVLCTSPCSSCKSSSYCLACISNLYLLNGQCLASCPSSYYSDNTQICNKCYGLCQTCSSKYYCLSCLTGYLSGGFCYSSCPLGTFADISSSSCLSCTSPCLQCIFQSTYCTSCTSGLVVYLGNCSSTCPIGTYQSTTSCLACSYPCVNCSGADACNQCLGGYLLYNGLTCINDTLYCPNNFYKIDGQYCVPLTQCPSNYYIDQDLKTCSEACSREKYTNTDTKMCVYSCQSDQYAGVDMVCVNFTTNPPISLMEMQVISFIQSSFLNIVVSFNQSVVWLNSNNQIYSITSATSRLLFIGAAINYSMNTFNPTNIVLKVTDLPMEANLNLPAYNLVSAVTNYPLQNPNITFMLPPFIPYEYDQIYQGQITSQFGQGLGWFILLLSVFFIFKNRLSDLYILWDTVQLLFILIYLDIQYPPTLNEFLRGLSITMFNFFPNMFTVSSIRNISDRPFYAYSYDNSFLRNAGPCLTLLVIMVGIYVLFKICEILIKKFQKCKEFTDKFPRVKKLIYQVLLRYRWHYTSDVMFLTYLNVFLFGIAEIYHIAQNNNNIASNVICVLCLAFYIFFPIFVGYKLHKHFPNISKGKLVENLKCFYRGIQRTNKFGVFLILIRYIRKLVYSIVIAIFSSQPMYALPILMATSVLMGLFIFIYTPFHKKLSNVVETLTQICLSIFFLAIAFVNFNNQSGNKSFNIILGYICCGILIFILFMLVFEVFSKTMFHLESQTPKIHNKPLPHLGIQISEEELRKKAGQFFDFIFPRIKKDFKFGDQSQDQIYHYEEGDSQNSENNEQRQRSWGIESSNSQQSDEFRHYDNNSESQQTVAKKKMEAPVYLIRCVKDIT